MSGRVFSTCVAAALVALASLAAGPAGAKEKRNAETSAAQNEPNVRKAIPKPSDRKPGELEGWTDSDSKQKSAAARKPKAEKVDKADKAAAGERSGDGGLPMPSTRRDPNDYAPVGFDKNGNFGAGLKF